MSISQKRFSKRPYVLLALCVALATWYVPAPVTAAAAQHSGPLYFIASGHAIELGFAAFLATHGGTPFSGLPITGEVWQDSTTVQYFQNIRLEWHPDAPEGERVTVSALGRMLGKSQLPVPAPPDPDVAYFQSTGHTLADGFLQYYVAHDGPRLLGAPITEELLESGRVVQYFVNAELTWRQDEGIRLAPLGTEEAQAQHWSPDTAPLAPQTLRASDTIWTGTIWPISPVTLDDETLPPGPLAGAATQVNVPVLAYHHIGDWPSPYTVSAANFSAQVGWLLQQGYTPVTVHDVFRTLFTGAPLPEHPVAITIDDGYTDAVTNVAVILRQYGVPATFFIPTIQSHIPPQVFRALDAEGFDIEAHSRTHPDLTSLTPSRAWWQIAGSKSDLEAWLGHPVDLMAYPYDAFNQQIIGEVVRAGYRGAVSGGGGHFYSASYLSAEPRILIDRADTLESFRAKVQGAPNP
ncbi:MAG: polysaccharide deacetylase family protein [Chloroflexi bacterium]|nr:polysaccharide deacetylase family protein [Chloroflexota bacterium]